MEPKFATLQLEFTARWTDEHGRWVECRMPLDQLRQVEAFSMELASAISDSLNPPPDKRTKNALRKARGMYRDTVTSRPSLPLDASAPCSGTHRN